MKALYKAGAHAGFELVDRPEPETGPGDVKIRVMTTGICGTDLHIESWDAWAQGIINAPLIAGHEFYGEVVEIGEDVAGRQGRGPGLRRGPHRLRDLPQLPRRPQADVHQHRRASASSATAPSPSTW